MPKLERVLHFKRYPAGGRGSVTGAVSLGGGTHSPVNLTDDADVLLLLTDQEIDLDEQTANTVFAAPDGAAGHPTFRALTVDDVALAMAVPTFSFGTAAAEGAASTTVRSDATIALFDATNPVTLIPDASGAPGSAGKAARRDHGHGIATAAPNSPSVSLSASAEGTGDDFARAKHTHQLDVTITPTWTGAHTWGTSTEIRLRASTQRIYSSATGQLDIDADTKMLLTAPTVELACSTKALITGLLEVDGDLQFVGAQQITTSAGNLTVKAAGDVLFDPTGDDVHPTTGYDLNLGILSKKWLTVHAAELWVENLVAQDTIATIGGKVIIAPSTTLIADCGISDTSVDVKHNNLLSGDVLWLMSGGKVEFMSVTSGPTSITGGYRYNVTRNLDGTGANQWYSGDAVVSTGQAGAGFIELYSLWGFKSPVVDHVFNYNDTGAVFSENYASSANWSLFDDGANTEVDDCVYFGVEGTTWDDLHYKIGTAAVYVATLTWEYWNGATWTSFTPTTTDFKSTGVLSTAWDVGSLTGWASTTVNGESAYWVRVRISAFTSWATLPTQEGQTVRRGVPQRGPTMVGWVRSSATYNDITERWAIGNLNALYGYGDNTYGVGLGEYASGKSNIVIDPTNGLRFRSYTTEHVIVAGDGDVFIGEDVSAPASTNFVIFTTAQTYNSEVVSAGDVLIGDNSATKGNIFWDKSLGAFLFRSGVQTEARLDADGLTFAWQDNLRWEYSGNLVGYIGWGAPLINSSNTGIQVQGDRSAVSFNSGVELVARDSVGAAASVLTLDTAILIAEVASVTVFTGDTDGLTIPKGLRVGSTASPDDNDIHFDGNLKSEKTSGTYDVYAFRGLTSPLDSTSWDGDSFSTTSKTSIDLSAVFGVPAEAKAILVTGAVRDSGSSGTDCYFILSPNNVAYEGFAFTCPGVDDAWYRYTSVVPCDGSGDVYYQVAASGSSTMDIYLWIWGYWI